jgi:hypothetical protein
VEKRDVKSLWRNLEKVLGPRETWSSAVARELWSALHAGQGKRRRTADHERLWCQLAGFCLRPGFGAPLDAWRAAQTFEIFGAGLQFQGDPHNWQAFWTLWRRIAGGLDEAAQRKIFQAIAPLLPPPRARAPVKSKGPKPEAIDEMIRLAASLERIGADQKIEAGAAIFERIAAEGPAAHLCWAIGRLGARVPFYGSGHACVPPPIASEWLAKLLALRDVRPEILSFSLAQLARMSGDRARDVDESIRGRVVARLRALGAPDSIITSVLEPLAMSVADEQRVFGESLPAGLRLIGIPDAPKSDSAHDSLHVS